MKKKLFFIVIIVLLIEIPCLSNSVRGFNCEVYALEVDKNNYFTNEEIRINASWELDYNPLTEYAYIQINIYNSSDNLIWNSSWYDEIGSVTEQWCLNTTQLKTTFLNNSNNIIIMLYLYFYDGELTRSFLKATKEITIFKRIPLCELIGFKNRINYSENLTFIAKFYDNEVENGSVLNNQLIFFKINSNISTIFQNNFTTNHLGIIEISLSTLVHLNIGLNTLIFKIIQSNIYNDSIFQFEIIVERNPVFINIIKFSDKIIKGEDLELQLCYFYYFNNTMIPLNNQSIKLEIFQNHSLIFSQKYNTDITGLLSITMSLAVLNLTGNIEDMNLNLKYNGNVFLQNKTISLTLTINESKVKNSLNSNLIFIITFSIISFIVPPPLLYKFKKDRKKSLAEVVIKY